MKTIATDFPDPKDVRRVPKPLMEKRRRDRINNSLETLRLLLLENTHNEKLRNPKVEKAEILESVVDFLKAEQEAGMDPPSSSRGRRLLLGEEAGGALSPQKHHHSYHDGMRACLLRVGHFIAVKSQELEDSLPPSPPCSRIPGDTQGLEPRPGHHEPLQQTLSSGPLIPGFSLALHRLPQNSVPCPSTPAMLSNTGGMVPAPKPAAGLGNTVWRPWPQ